MKLFRLLSFVGLMGLVSLHEASATTDVTVLFSSATAGMGVVITSGTARRVDNQYGGSLSSIIDPRRGFSLQNKCATASIFCGFNSLVSTVPGNGFSGWEIAGSSVSAGSVIPSFVEWPINRNVQVWCTAADIAGAAGCPFTAIQFAKE